MTSKIWEPCSIGQFRLLFIEPADDRTDDIHISLEVCELGGAIEYQTLSYTWGDSHDKASRVITRSGDIAVTPKLHDILVIIRGDYAFNDLNTHKLGLWVDAICIDQMDPDDREQQVGIIGSIYSRSTRLIIWLGHYFTHAVEEDIFWLVENLMRELERTSRPIDTNASSPKESLSQHPYWTKWWVVQEILRMFGSTNMSANAPKGSLSQHPYWRRCWIVQEILQTPPKKRWVFFGSHAVSMKELIEKDLLHVHHDFAWRLQDISTDDGSEWRTDGVQSLGPGTPYRSLLENAYRFSQRNCTDSRDRIYSLLSISSDDVGRRPVSGVSFIADATIVHLFDSPLVVRYSVRADYRLSERETFLSLGKLYATSCTQVVPLMAYATVHNIQPSDSTSRPSWPTWIPYWSKRVPGVSSAHLAAVEGIHVCGAQDTCFRTRSHAQSPEPFDSSICSVPVHPPTPVHESDPPLLKVHGRLIENCSQHRPVPRDSVTNTNLCGCSRHGLARHSSSFQAVTQHLPRKKHYYALLLKGCSTGFVLIQPHAKPAEIHYRLHACFTVKKEEIVRSSENLDLSQRMELRHDAAPAAPLWHDSMINVAQEQQDVLIC